MEVSRYNYAAQFGDVATLCDQLRALILAGKYILSKELQEFERDFGRFLGVPFVRGVNSGTDALVLALRSLGISHGDEVITQANTFYATVASICLVGAKPVLVDVDPTTFSMDYSQIEASLTPRTKAIIPVHLYGKPAPLTHIIPIAERWRLFLVEDAAQAHGAMIGNKRVGTFGTIGCFSFHPSKNLAAAGDAGAVVTSSPALDHQLRVLRELGQERQNQHIAIGLNSKLDSLQALILSQKLPRLDQWNEQRRHVALQYRHKLTGLPIAFQAESDDETHVYHLFQIRVNGGIRDSLLQRLCAAGIDAVVRYPCPIHLQEAFRDQKWTVGQFPVAERLAQELLALPIRPDLSEESIDYVCRIVRQFYTGDVAC
jgi:dTDP-4-amino-4,6-dideoxygalactose transaminase